MEGVPLDGGSPLSAESLYWLTRCLNGLTWMEGTGLCCRKNTAVTWKELLIGCFDTKPRREALNGSGGQ
jgi:hypothetical protein